MDIFFIVRMCVCLILRASVCVCFCVCVFVFVFLGGRAQRAAFTRRGGAAFSPRLMRLRRPSLRLELKGGNDSLPRAIFASRADAVCHAQVILQSWYRMITAIEPPPLPYECYLYNVLYELPMPDRGKSVQLCYLYDEIIFQMPGMSGATVLSAGPTTTTTTTAVVENAEGVESTEDNQNIAGVEVRVAASLRVCMNLDSRDVVPQDRWSSRTLTIRFENSSFFWVSTIFCSYLQAFCSKTRFYFVHQVCASGNESVRAKTLPKTNLQRTIAKPRTNRVAASHRVTAEQFYRLLQIDVGGRLRDNATVPVSMATRVRASSAGSTLRLSRRSGAVHNGTLYGRPLTGNAGKHRTWRGRACRFCGLTQLLGSVAGAVFLC